MVELFISSCCSFQCTKSCGTGYRLREVRCVDDRFQPSSSCRRQDRPTTREVCNEDRCPRIGADGDEEEEGEEEEREGGGVAIKQPNKQKGGRGGARSGKKRGKDFQVPFLNAAIAALYLRGYVSPLGRPSVCPLENHKRVCLSNHSSIYPLVFPCLGPSVCNHLKIAKLICSQ